MDKNSFDVISAPCATIASLVSEKVRNLEIYEHVKLKLLSPEGQKRWSRSNSL
jgi:hypothetical protein